MKINEVTLTETRIPTGLGRQTVPAPFDPARPNSPTNFHGNPDKYPFSSVQRKNYEELKRVLAAEGIKLREIWAQTYEGDVDYIRRYKDPNGKANLTRFVVIAGPVDAPTFVWEKYEGSVAGGGRNTVFYNGVKQKLTNFLGKSWDTDNYF